ncbi:MAG: hypothetical protein PUB32_03005 [Clostridiales bacterium]|nr:hypothetical protein [Clostridiales bacterium]
MDECTLQALSRAMTHLIFRNGVVESLHADGACLDNETMKKLNRDINNRLYTLLFVWFNGTDVEVDRLARTLSLLARFYGKEWDKAKRVDFLVL